MWEDVETRCLKRLGAGEWGSYLYQDFREMVLLAKNESISRNLTADFTPTRNYAHNEGMKI
ncbi:MAG: hypothetical protein C4323_17825 [Mastigocladus sp. ERB_26_2]